MERHIFNYNTQQKMSRKRGALLHEVCSKQTMSSSESIEHHTSNIHARIAWCHPGLVRSYISLGSNCHQTFMAMSPTDPHPFCTHAHCTVYLLADQDDGGTLTQDLTGYWWERRGSMYAYTGPGEWNKWVERWRSSQVEEDNDKYIIRPFFRIMAT